MTRFLPSLVLICSVLFLALVNLLPNANYKGAQHPIESKDARVYAANPKLADDPEIPVHRYGDAILPEDTGEHVVVYLNANYQGRELWNKPKGTLAILAVTVPLYCLASVLARRTSSH